MKHPQNEIDIFRHSLAHVMAAAVQKLWPQAKFGIGPIIENGFYYDIDLISQCHPEQANGATSLASDGGGVSESKDPVKKEKINLTPQDLPKIQKQMKKIIAQNLKFEKKEISIDRAIKLFKDLDQTYKIELLKDIKKHGTTEISSGRDAIYGVSTNEKDAINRDAINRVSTNTDKKVNMVTIYSTGDFVDLCRGPHVASTSQLKNAAFKLDRLAGAYWRGDEKNPMLTRIYGLAFESTNELKDYTELLKEAEKRDHRKLGQELDLFMLDEEVGQGLPLWLPNGAILRQQMENFVLNEYQKRGYKLVRSPHIASYKLFEQSGHLGFYKDGMYSPMDIDGEDYYVKPMNCPFHVKMYQRDLHSYRELPIRYTELGTVYRYERSGTLHGLTRVRGFTQDDAHIICTPDQLIDELVGVIDLTKYILKTFGFNKFKVVLSIRDPKDKKKFMGSDKDWQLAEAGLKKALEISGWDFETEAGEAVFYGPKIDIKVFDAVGRDWQISTLQLDFNLPEQFAMSYIDKDGSHKKPFMLHRALLGSLERFTGVLIEHYAGAFPVWLSPVQIRIITVAESHIQHAQKLADEFLKNNFRVEIDKSDETVGNKIRKAIKSKIPYMLVIGDKEMSSDKLHVRQRGSDKVEKISKNKFIQHVAELIKERSQGL